MRYHHRSSAALFIFMAALIAPQEALAANDETKDNFIIPPQLEEELGPEVLDALREEQQRHRNEAVLTVPLDDTSGFVIATFGNFTMLTQTEEHNATSWLLFRGDELIQRGDTTFNLDETTGIVDVTGTIESVRTGDRLVSEVMVAQDPSQPDGCSFIIDGRMTVAREGTETGSTGEPEVVTHTVFDVCTQVVMESATDGSLPDDVIEEFEPGIERTMARLVIEDETIKPPGFADFGLGGRFLDIIGEKVIKCAWICAICARFPPMCGQCFRCLRDP